jgi:GxxExxY protein
LSERAIGAAIEVHRQLGRGLLESTYEQCLCFELAQRSIAYVRQVPLPVAYKGNRLDCGYGIDLIVEQQVIVKVKSVDQLLRVHGMSRLEAGLLPNFNAVLLKHGMRRYALSSSARSAVDLS